MQNSLEMEEKIKIVYDCKGSSSSASDLCIKAENPVIKQENEFEEECMKSVLDTLKKDQCEIKTECCNIKQEEHFERSLVLLDSADMEEKMENAYDCNGSNSPVIKQENEFREECVKSVLEILKEEDQCEIKAECVDIKDIKSEENFGSEIKHKTIFEMHKCPHCEYETKDNPSLKYHIECLHKNMSLDHGEHMETNQTLRQLPMHQGNECSYESASKSNSNNQQLQQKDSSQVQTYKSHKGTFENTFEQFMQTQKWTQTIPRTIPSKEHVHRCDKCSYTSKKKHDLKRHQLRHSEEVKMYQCDRCSYESKTKITFKRHQLTHKSSQVQMYKCDKCNFQTKYKNYIKKHQVVHKTVVCAIM